MKCPPHIAAWQRMAATLVAVGALFGTAPAGAAGTYPSKPIRMVVGFAAGGPTDVIARVLAQDMSVTLGQSVLVDNKTGANSLIATKEVKAADADGYTVLFASLSHNVNALLMKERAGYDPLKDFVPVSNAAMLPLVAVTAANSPYQTLPELIKAAKTGDGVVSFGSAGNGGSGHLAAELLGTTAKVHMTHVPFRGNGPALTEVMAGRVSFTFYPIIGIADYVNQKRLRVLAVGTAKRLPEFPDAPTMAESGFPGFEETAPWVGLLAPAGTPREAVDKLHDAMVKALAKPAVKERLRSLGAIPVGDTPAQFAAYLKQDQQRWQRVIQSAGIKAE
ncbi:Bug family tripartite tricarboxylate transporter substrate binding protein [Cupriavidus sp. RAF12]|uniref:Bug family tripartite tricarboxylate transporter substrate binding protein n=1 Tax=Cupriavidus sp. RAF12 TaxID=3233050 RepID=UPI003F91FD29